MWRKGNKSLAHLSALLLASERTSFMVPFRNLENRGRDLVWTFYAIGILTHELTQLEGSLETL